MFINFKYVKFLLLSCVSYCHSYVTLKYMLMSRVCACVRLCVCACVRRYMCASVRVCVGACVRRWVGGFVGGWFCGWVGL